MKMKVFVCIFKVGYTLVHMAIRFHREDMLAVLLTATEASAKASKRVPCMVCPDLATDIRRQVVTSIRQRKGEFACSYLTDCATFSLPAGNYVYSLWIDNESRRSILN